MSIRTLLVDDEDLARGLLREYLQSERDIEIIGECRNGFDAVKAVTAQKPDLLFLDVQMPKLDGFEVLELIGSEVAVVFTTAHDQYATKAFDAAAVDYLLKPFDADRFRTALNRARVRLGEGMRTESALALKAAAQAPGQYASRIVVKDGTRIQIIPTKDLDWAEAQDDYVSLHTGGRAHLKQQTISSLEAMLDPEEFVRIHRSYLVRLECVSKIEPYTKDARIAVLRDSSKLPVSRAGYLRLKELMEKV